MAHKYTCPVLKDLRVLFDDPAEKFLKKKKVNVDQYLLYIYTSEVRKSNWVGYIITTLLVLILGGLGYGVGQEDGYGWIVALSLGGLGLLIGMLALRQMRGQQSKYFDNPGADSPGNYLRIGILARLDVKYMKKYSAVDWEKVKNFSPNLNGRIYQRFVGDPKNEKEKQEIMSLTPGREALGAKIGKLERVFWLLVLVGVLFPFFEGEFFLWWAWFSIGVAFFFLGLKGFVERRMGTFVAADFLDVYGWPAQVMAVVCMLVALMIFVLPGVLGMFDSFGIHLMTLIFD